VQQPVPAATPGVPTAMVGRTVGEQRDRRVRGVLAAIAAIVLGAVVVATVVTVVVGRARLQDARHDTDAAWSDTREILHGRYQLVGGLAAAVAVLAGDDHEVVVAARQAVSGWNTRVGAPGTPADDEVLAANAVEGQARRLVAFVDATPALTADPGVAQARTALAASDPTTVVATYDDAVDALDRTRSSFAGRLARDLVDAPERSRLELPGAA
jgi:hypothetical protein